MSTQRFYANPRDTFSWPNGAIGYRPGEPFDCLGPYAKVRNCPVDGATVRLTAYATDYPDTHFSVPACTRRRGRYIGGFFTSRDDGIVFVPYNRYRHLLSQDSPAPSQPESSHANAA